jgi:uncharacterized protein YrrD
MKRSLKELYGYSLKVKDGTKGKVRDFLFDEETWTLRYMVTDLGNLFSDKKVVIPRVFFDKPDWEQHQFLIHMTSDEIERSPKLEEHQPVSRQYEELLNRFFGFRNYWSASYIPSFGMPEMAIPNQFEGPLKVIREEDIDSRMRSFREVNGYQVECLDKKSGQVTDFIIDDKTWQIVYFIIDIGSWYSRNKRVMLAANRITEINYESQKIGIDQSSTVLEKAPEFDPKVPVNVEYEKNL